MGTPLQMPFLITSLLAILLVWIIFSWAAIAYLECESLSLESFILTHFCLELFCLLIQMPSFSGLSAAKTLQPKISHLELSTTFSFNAFSLSPYFPLVYPD